MFARAFLFGSLMAAIAPAAVAQTSSALILPEPAQAGTTPPSLVMPLDIPDGEYPLESLLAAEEGRVSLNVVINIEGKAIFAQILTGSGIPRLDAAAKELAAGWVFHPAMRNGEAVGGSVKVELTWKAPLVPARDYDSDVPALPNGAIPPKPITTRAIIAGDYPPTSIRAGQRGIALLRYMVQPDGSVGDIGVARSSGFGDLDNAAIAMVKPRWKFEPATLNGNPIAALRETVISFQMDPAIFDRQKMRCYDRPISATENIQVWAAVVIGRVITRNGRPPTREQLEQLAREQVAKLPPSPNTYVLVRRWTFVAKNGEVEDTLFETPKGLMRPTNPLLQSMQQGAPYLKPQADKGCWYFDPIRVQKTN